MPNILEKVRIVQDFPKPGIGFYDITTLLKDGKAFKEVIDDFDNYFDPNEYDVIAGIESRGFIFASALAYKKEKGLILIRKPGKLPAEKYEMEYQLEYGTDKVEIHKDSISKNTRVLVLDDLLATGGTANASCDLIEQAGGMVAGVGFVIELGFLNGRRNLASYNLYSQVIVKE